MEITEKLDLIIAELRAAQVELNKLGKELDAIEEARLEHVLQQRKAHAAVDWAYKGKTARAVYDWDNGKVGVVSGKEKIL
jgi:hypothetical protein